MANKMLIDAAHPEETRVVVVEGSRVEEFDYETVTKAQISGNIYLARVTRVEPSLQAAFVEYGGGRHGFLAFSEIHPDYYQIPAADREALLEAERAAQAEEDEEENGPNGRKPRRRDAKRASENGGDAKGEARKSSRRSGGREKGPHKQRLRPAPFDPDAKVAAVAAESIGTDEFWVRPKIDIPTLVEPTSEETGDAPSSETTSAAMAEPAAVAAETVSEAVAPSALRDMDGEAVDIEAEADDDGAGAGLSTVEDAPNARSVGADDDEERGDVEEVGAVDVQEEIKPRAIRMRDYKIQEVIKRRQIVLVQVVKEERGTKGAALTTYLSLAGRYCVLMPNTPRGGGISRKITSAADRKRLKALANEFEVPEGMGLIVRTAGANRTKAEIKRDYEYLLRQWASIRELTLRSIAPALIFEEGSLIKRAIRDLYNKDIESVLVEGEDAYREAKDYMKMLMPSHAKNVQPYRETTPLFIKHQIESQVSRMLDPRVQLKSGGYLIINVTEALVAVDVNSGKSTKEGSIEDTALKTNLEAAEEVARQMKLRDLAGLIVIDFIDMEEPRNNRSVEKRLKERLKNDRARIQIGRISGFGLLEMSRQRLRPGLLEATTCPCPVCSGAGVVRSDESMALVILRGIEEECVRGRSAAVKVAAPMSAANYILNYKRARIAEIEARYDIQVFIEGDPALPSTEYKLERTRPVARDSEEPRRAVQIDGGYRAKVEDAEVIEEEAPAEAERPTEADDGEGGRRSRRRRRSRDSDRAERREEPVEEIAAETAADEARASDPEAGPDADDDEDGAGKKRRRGRRGGRRRRRRDEDGGSDPMPVIDFDAEAAEASDAPAEARPDETVSDETVSDAAEAGSDRTEAAEPVENGAAAVAVVAASEDVSAPAPDPASEVVASDAADDVVDKAAAAGDAAEASDIEVDDETQPEVAPAAQAAAVEEKPAGPPRTGWWALRRNA
ncbi:MAG: Rne/Rng family ribonuclease [Neomegalonema sp.]|nr:Rne/Rng family ribonuclease [Neomegalonema sp.]